MQDQPPDGVVANGGWVRRKRLVRREPGANTMRVVVVCTGIASAGGGVWLGVISVPVSVWAIYAFVCVTLLAIETRRLLALIDAGFEEEVEVLESRDFESDVPPPDPRNLY